MDITFGIIADLHIGPDGQYKNVTRKLGGKFGMSLLTDVVAAMRLQHRPHFMIQLGDIIQDQEYEIDRIRMQSALSVLEQLDCPLIHVFGNHDAVHIPVSELCELVKVTGPYYSLDLGGLHIVVLYAHFPRHRDAVIDAAQLAWLERDLAGAAHDVVVCIHPALDDQDLKNNFWYIGDDAEWLTLNRREVRSVLERSKKVRAVFQGHVHWNHYQVINDIPYFTVQSMVENFVDDGEPTRSYALVSINDTSVRVAVEGRDAAAFVHHKQSEKRRYKEAV